MNTFVKISSILTILQVITGCDCYADRKIVWDSAPVIIDTEDNIWQSDQGDGTYKNPVLFADYSDPDVIRVGKDFYMTSSSFNCVPGLPILHSCDLVNWSIIGYALKKLIPSDTFDSPCHGCGVWAPAIRYHNRHFWIYFGDPDQGIFMIKSPAPAGPWSDPLLVEAGKGLIDPCPFWESDVPDSKAYLVHAFAGSRAGIKSILVIKEMNSEGTKTLGSGVLVFDGHKEHPTVEGPKLYKKGGFYYIFAPAGGVKEGWQLALRSKYIYGPYEVRTVMQQGNTAINGPHQGAWVETPSGESWFLHFQDREAFGRVVHLQPLSWKEDWPMIGIDQNKDGIGEPVLTHKKPDIHDLCPVAILPVSDEFNAPEPGLQWQWQANPQNNRAFSAPGYEHLQLFAVPVPADFENLSSVPNLLLQKLPGPSFTATTRLKFHPSADGEKTGLVIMGSNYAYIGIRRLQGTNELVYAVCFEAFNKSVEKVSMIDTLETDEVYFSIQVDENALCRFGYSVNGTDYIPIAGLFKASAGKWIGAKLGFFCIREGFTNNAGYVEIDWFRVTGK